MGNRNFKYPLVLEKGMRFERWEVLNLDESSIFDKNGSPIVKSQWKYYCKCDCGNIKTVYRKHLIAGSSCSCGCLGSERTSLAHEKFNLITEKDNIITIIFFNNKGSTIIDKEDYEKIRNYCWCLSSTGYAYASKKLGNNKKIKLHRLIMSAPNDKLIDHINHNPLDNRKKNLRICTSRENAQNQKKRKNCSRKYVGVHRFGNKWRASLTFNYDTVWTETFLDEEGALKARILAEKKYFNGKGANTIQQKDNM